MPLFEPTIPAERMPKPKKQRRSKKRRKINTGKLFLYVAGLVSVAVGNALIKLSVSRTAAGNPPQGDWVGLGMILIIFPLFCAFNSVRVPKQWRPWR